MQSSQRVPLLNRRVGLFSAITLVVANMIGTGVFTTSGLIMGELHSSQALLLCWGGGGLFALAGAFCYAELGAMFPRSGGDYVFLRESFGRYAAFLSGWISLIVGFSAPVAAAAIAFSCYAFGEQLWFGNNYIQLQIGEWSFFDISPQTLIACGVVLVFSFLHSGSIGVSKGIQNVLTLFKFSLITVFIVIGFFLGDGSWSHFSTTEQQSAFEIGNFATALIFVSFAYSGWNAAAYLGGEIKNPGKNLPIALIAGTLLVTVLYLLLNTVYIYSLPAGELAGSIDVGRKAAGVLFGNTSGAFFSIAIAIGVLSVISAMTMAGPRVYFAMARDGVFFKFFGNMDFKKGNPARAVWLQCCLAILMIITTSFDILLLYIGVLLSLSSIMTVLGMIKLRVTQRQTVRPYKCIAYPIVPIFFIVGNVWIVAFSLWMNPAVILYAGATLAIGVLVEMLYRSKSDTGEVSDALDEEPYNQSSVTCPLCEPE
jgi:APA family basic amino acid/polyamine antiporter